MILNDVASWATIAGGFAVLVTPLLVLLRVLRSTDRRLLRIELQHQNNGGASLRDAVDRIERKVDANGEKQQEHLVEAARQEAAFTAHVQQCGTTVVVHPAQQPPPDGGQ